MTYAFTWHLFSEIEIKNNSRVVSKVCFPLRTWKHEEGFCGMMLAEGLAEDLGSPGDPT